MNLEENRELGVVRLHNFNSRFPIHGKFLVPKNVNWEVVLYIGIRTLKNLVHEIIFNIYIIRIDILHAMEKFPISFV